MPKWSRSHRPCVSKRQLKRGLVFLLKVGLVAFLSTPLLVLPLRWIPPLTSSFMLQSALFHPQGIGFYRYTWKPSREISPYLGLAAIAGEDQRFPKHHGFDIEELKQAVADYRQGEGSRGASTITQQVAKNLYLWPGQSLIRKGFEAWFTILIETFWSKQRILEVYVNIAQFGDRVFGAEAASQTFFGKSAIDLSWEEAGLLTAVLPGPEIYFVEAPSATVRQRQSWILQQMDQLGIDYLKTLSR